MNLFKRTKDKEIERQHFNAGIQGFLLTKSDRINRRIEQFAQTVKRQNSLIAVEDFNRCIKSIQILIAQELTYKGNTRDTNIIYLYSGTAKNWRKIKEDLSR